MLIFLQNIFQAQTVCCSNWILLIFFSTPCQGSGIRVSAIQKPKSREGGEKEKHRQNEMIQAL